MPSATHSDSPIDNEQEDRLGRQPFAASVARQLISLPSSQCYVLAIEGPWGSGKTSILRLVQQSIQEKCNTLWFNPWLFRNSSELLVQYFAELRAALAQNSKADELGTALTKYSAMLAPLRKIPVLGIDKVSGLVLDLADKAGTALRGDGSVTAQRRAVENLLRMLDRPLVVFCDDLDRLHGEEALEVVRLVRLVADFPNVRYVLSYDRRHFVDALGGQERGSSYLEKVVQLTYDVPAPSRKLMRNFIVDEINAALHGAPHREVEFNRFHEIFAKIVEPLVRTPRDVRRLTNVLAFLVHAHREEICFEDLFALAAVRCFLPLLHDALSGHMFMVAAGTHSFGSAFKKRQAEAVSTLRKLEGTHSQVVEELLDEVFPITLRNVVQDGSDLERWRAARRVAHVDVLRIYLESAVDVDDLDTQYVEQVVRALGSRSALEHLLHELTGPQLEQLIERLRDFGRSLPEDGVEVGVQVFLDQMGRMREGAQSLLDLGGPRLRLSNFVLRMLRRCPEADRGESLERIIQRLALHSGCHKLCRLVGHEKGVGYGLVDDVTWKRIEALARTRLLTATAAELALEPLLYEIALFYRDDREVLERLSTLLDHDEVFIRMLRSCCHENYSWIVGSAIQQKKFAMPWKSLCELFGREKLLASVEGLQIDELADERDRAAVTLAQQLAKESARPENDANDWGSPAPARQAVSD